ncbi:amino acid ABC transporter permease [Butyricicoccus sp.]|uniref:amino acid ABC transporter permease n=1 Tax=Butyricicoccus sp. TaxID=2049021 RepID=UPI003D7E9A93
MQYFISVVQEISAGISSSLLLFVLTLIFSMPLGLLVCFGRMSKIKPLSMVFGFIISVLRGTPLMLQLVVVFFGPYYVFGMNVSNTWRFWAAIVGFSINYAAYFAEIYRSGIQSIPKGQYEAAEVLGYTKTQTFCKIIFPQMVKRVLPPVTNEIITLTKDTSLAFVLAYAEMFTLAKQVAASDASIAPLFVAGLFYYVFNYVVAFVMERLERKLAYYQ